MRAQEANRKSLRRGSRVEEDIRACRHDGSLLLPEDGGAFELQRGKSGGGEGVACAVNFGRFLGILLQKIDVDCFGVRIDKPELVHPGTCINVSLGLFVEMRGL